MVKKHIKPSTKKQKRNLLNDFGLTGTSSVEFICQKCSQHEDIPREVVELLDGTDLAFSADQPPQFSCENCDGVMSPVYYKNQLGHEFILDEVYLADHELKRPQGGF